MKIFRIERIELFCLRIESNFEFSVKTFFELFRIRSNVFEFFPSIFFSKLQIKRTIFQSQTFLGKHIILSSSLEKKDQNAIEIVLKITKCASKDSQEKVLSNFSNQKTEFEKFANFSNYFLSNRTNFELKIIEFFELFLPFRINRIVNFRIESNEFRTNSNLTPPLY